MTFRRPFVARWIMRVFPLAAIAFVVDVLWLSPSGDSDLEHEPLWARSVFAVFVLVAVVPCLALLAKSFQRLTLDGHGVTVAGLIRRRTWTWSEISDVGAEPDTATTISPFLRLVDGRRVWLRCANAFVFGNGPAAVRRTEEAVRTRLAEPR